MTDSEAQLVERAQRDPEAFGVLYERYVDKIYNYIYFRTGNDQDAEDLTAKTFHQALAHIHTYRHRGLAFSAWLYRIAHNIVANWYRERSRKPTQSLDDIWPMLADGRQLRPDHAVEKQVEEEALLSAIRDLPADRQMLLVLKYGERLSNQQIGRMMGRSEGAIKSLYHRTIDELRAALGKRGY